MKKIRLNQGLRRQLRNIALAECRLPEQKASTKEIDKLYRAFAKLHEKLKPIILKRMKEALPPINEMRVLAKYGHVSSAQSVHVKVTGEETPMLFNFVEPLPIIIQHAMGKDCEKARLSGYWDQYLPSEVRIRIKSTKKKALRSLPLVPSEMDEPVLSKAESKLMLELNSIYGQINAAQNRDYRSTATYDQKRLDAILTLTNQAKTLDDLVDVWPGAKELLDQVRDQVKEPVKSASEQAAAAAEYLKNNPKPKAAA